MNLASSSMDTKWPMFGDANICLRHHWPLGVYMHACRGEMGWWNIYVEVNYARLLGINFMFIHVK